ncbi:MAG: hypothetical protein AB8B63_20180 [Granulosicoccus sp.]
MSVFDTLAESRYQQWLERQPESPVTPAAEADKTASRKSFEALLYQDILMLLDKAAKSRTLKERERNLHQAQGLEMQLLVSLERQGLNKVSLVLQKSIRQKKRLLNLA